VQTDESLATYYALRAPEFESAYALPELQPDLGKVRECLHGLVAGQDVLEIACGTGYWTRVMAQTARSVTATDINPALLELARGKPAGPAKVTFRVADAWRLEDVGGGYTAGAALFWWSHVARARLGLFLEQLSRVLAPGALMVFADHLPAHASRSTLSSRDADGNNCQSRRLPTGEEFEVIKNYPTEAELHAAVAGVGTEVHCKVLTHFWLLSCRISRSQRHVVP
jgi:demethylmenaquinone methyltransferase/2-methoxy-6-polyprenyl-1,4-benzoquinol methylase